MMNIRKKLLLLPILLVTLPVTLILFIAGAAFNEAFHSMRDSELQNNVHFISDAYTNMADNLHAITNVTAHNGKLAEAIYYYADFGGEREPINLVLKEIFDKQPMDLLMVTDRSGLGLADRGDLGHFNFEVSPTLLEDVVTTGQSFVTAKLVDGRLMLVSASPIHYISDSDPIFVGVLLVGQTLDQRFLNKLKGQSQLMLAIYQNGRVVETTAAALGALTIDQSTLGLLDHGQGIIHEEKEPVEDTILELSYLPVRSRAGHLLGTVVIAIDNAGVIKQLWQTLFLIVGVSLLMVAVAGVVGWRNGRSMANALEDLAEASQKASGGDLSVRVKVSRSDEIGLLGKAFNAMVQGTEEQNQIKSREEWLKNSGATLNDHLRGDQDLVGLGSSVIDFLAQHLGAGVGAFYASREEDGVLIRVGSFAHHVRKNLADKFNPGEGIVGQAALEKSHILITRVPKDYMRIQSGLGGSPPSQLLVFPFLLNDQVRGVVELGSFGTFTDLHLEMLGQASENIAMAIQAAQSRVKLQDMLQQTQEQARQMTVQSRALQQSNEKLRDQADALKKSEARLQQQQEELRVSNEELEEQAQMLEEQKEEANQKNEQLQLAQSEIERKAADLELASKYKSEFLSNMSHELRTPLNSLLILAKSFANNDEGNLTDRQMEDAEIIHSSGADLLGLINEILDLSKIEAGRMDVLPESLQIDVFAQEIQRQFKHVAEKAGVDFALEMAENLPESLRTDMGKVDRIVKNLLANAFKFTKEGGVTISFKRADPAWRPQSPVFPHTQAIDIVVRDTGIGIPRDKQRLIFEAFQQADGTTSRQFGGTGLGLTISTQLAKLLGGEIKLQSAEGEGAVFTLHLPELPEGMEEDIISSSPYGPSPFSTSIPRTAPSSVFPSAPASHPSQNAQLAPENNLLAAAAVKQAAPPIPDDRDEIQPGDRVMLVIEDDPKFARIVCDLSRGKGFKCLTAADGKSGLEMAAYYKPTGIVLDIGLPILDGLTVLERLKENSETRHIPVHIMSAMDESLDGMRIGAIGHVTKPVNREEIEEAFTKIDHFAGTEPRAVLLVEDDDNSRRATMNLLGAKDITITQAATGAEAITLLKECSFDCMILDLGLPDIDGFELLDRIAAEPDLSRPPVIVYSGRDISREEYDRLKAYTNSIVVKGVKSAERLLDEVVLFLHRVERDLPEEQRQIVRRLHDQEEVFKEKCVLVVDDDVRNTYALARQLERKNIKVLMAANGEKAISVLEEHPETDIVLMDIMMPVMDGFQATREIRARVDRYRDIPIIALTAKAMAEDKKKCLDAGANDYLSKPVDMDKLFSMLRVWMHQ
ncbi:MAG: response regulator [Magnetococcales bacterium]|nr:response regulator [Magnetococcales bacterium]